MLLSSATLILYPLFLLVLLLCGAAQAFEAKCASPSQSVMQQGRADLRAIRPRPNPSTRALSPQATFAQEYGFRLATCHVWGGRARLGGAAGILITATDSKQNKVSLFCEQVTATTCSVRMAKTRKVASAWARGSFKSVPISRGQFAYRIKKEDTGTLLIILFGPDITTYLNKAPALPQI